MNVTKTVKSYIFQPRKADPMIQILPLDKSNNSQNDILEGEVVLPDEAKRHGKVGGKNRDKRPQTGI